MSPEEFSCPRKFIEPMNKKQLIVAFLFTVFASLLFILPAYSSIATELDYLKQPPVTDEQLKELAIEEGIIPLDADKAHVESELSQKNTVAIWCLMEAEDKIELIDTLKNIWKEKESIIIRLSSAYYANELNGIIYGSIQQGDISTANKRGLGVMFKTVAIMDGDYQDKNNTDKVKLLRNYIGEEMFEEYKKVCPDKYNKLLK